jgi:hypothetical protein
MQVGGKKMVKTNPFGALAAVGGALVAVGLLVLMLVVVEVRPAEATFPGNPGRIAHMSDQDGDLEIYTIDPTGGTPVQLTHNTTNESFPDYSPNGREIAYAANDDTAPSTPRSTRSMPPGVRLSKLPTTIHTTIILPTRPTAG